MQNVAIDHLNYSVESFREYKNKMLEQFNDARIQCSIHFERALKMLYGSDPLDLIALENELDSMTYFLGVDLIPGDLNITRPEKKFPIIDPLEYNKIFEGLK